MKIAINIVAICLMMLVFSFPMEVYGESETNQFSHRQSIMQATFDGYQMLEITDDIYRYSENNLRDIRIFDKNLEAEPFFIEYATNIPGDIFEETAREEVRFSTHEENQTTRLSIPLGEVKNRSIFGIVIKTDTVFKRMFSFEQFPGQELFNAADKPRGEELILYSPNEVWKEDINIYIENMDAKPLDIDKIIIIYYREFIIFKTTPKDLFVYLGNSNLRRSPIYDINQYKNDVLEELYFRKASLGQLETLEIAKTPEPTRVISDDTLMVVVVVVVSTVLVVIILQSYLKKRN